MMQPTHQGYITVPGGEIWYKIMGGNNTIKTPLIVLNGGPGCPHDYLQPLEALADERPVIFYDQLGSGKSDRPEDTSLWQIERFVEELECIRKYLNVERLHLFGHSWGSMLATDYTLAYPQHVVSLIQASPPLDMKRWISDLEHYRVQLPRQTQETLTHHEQAGSTHSLEYIAATMEFYKRHVCRLEPWPEPMQRMQAGFGATLYNTMWGPNEFYMTGNLINYNRTDRLYEIKVPSLFTCGYYDEATPKTTLEYASLCTDARTVIFNHSAHQPHLEETALYIKTLRKFLRQIEKSSWGQGFLYRLQQSFKRFIPIDL